MRDGGGTLEKLAARALAGDSEAVDELVRSLKDDVYNLSMRMLGDPHDAEDATQEILVKIITRLDTFRGDSGLRTWAWKIASNHLLSEKRSRRPTEEPTFEGLEDMLAQGIAAAMPPPSGLDARILEEEVKIGCTSTMLACLDRGRRLAFILADVFDLSGPEGAEVLGIAPDAFRKRVSRARSRMRSFMTANCGLVSADAPCRCTTQISPSIHAGVMDPANLRFATHLRSDDRVGRQMAAIDAVDEPAAVFRSHPAYSAPEALVGRLREMVAASPD